MRWKKVRVIIILREEEILRIFVHRIMEKIKNKMGLRIQNFRLTINKFSMQKKSLRSDFRMQIHKLLLFYI